jgi:hypothetical protein
MSAVPKQPAQADGIADPRQVDLSATINVSKASHRDSKNWGNTQLALQELIEWISQLTLGDKSQGEVWAPATLSGERRLASNVLGTDLAVFDSDAGHTLDELKAAFTTTGWYARIIPSSSWGKDETEASADPFDAWVKEQLDPNAVDLPERYLIEHLHKTPAVAKGATVLKRRPVALQDKNGRKRIRHMIWFKHQPCEKYRIICVLVDRYDLSTAGQRRAWTRHYDAMIDVVGLPLDHSTGSPERLFYLSCLSPDRIDKARRHQAEVPGGYIDVADLPAPKPRERTRRGRVGTGRVHDQDGGEFIWTDPETGKPRNLTLWAASGAMQYFELADALQDNGWPQDDRGEQDGKHHIECPFWHEHTTLHDGGAFAYNASDFARTGMTDLKPGAGIYCNHNACRGRDRLEFLTELLDKGGLKAADLDKARKAQAADDFEVIEDPDSIDLRPLIKPDLTWTLDTIKANASPLRRLRKEDPDKYEQARFYWDLMNRIDHDELDQLCDEAPDDVPPKFGDPADDSEDPIARAIDYMNRRHFVTSVEGKARVVTPKEVREVERQTRQVTYEFSSFADITHLYAHKKVWIETKQGPKQIPIGPLWLNHSDRRTYLGGMMFKPKGAVPPDYYNTWQGFGVEPKAGDWSKLRWHMLHIICQKNESHFDWLLKWCAHMVQYPMIKSQVAIVMRGGEGCGKGTLGHVLRRIAGSHSFYVSSQRGVVGNFNAHLADRLLLFADEALFAGDKQHDGVLKALVTESKTMIERKGIDPIQQESYLRIVMATNNDWAVPASIKARRFFVLDVPDTKTGDKAYFDPLHAEIDNGGLAAFLHDLLQVDLTGWNYAKAPQTAGLMDQKIFSLRGPHRWYFTRLARAEDDAEVASGRLRADGTLPADMCAVWKRRLGKTELYDEYIAWFRDQKAEYQPVSDAQFWKDLRAMAPSLITERKRKAGRKGMVHLPPLALARAEFETFMGDKVPWPTDDDDED